MWGWCTRVVPTTHWPNDLSLITVFKSILNLTDLRWTEIDDPDRRCRNERLNDECACYPHSLGDQRSHWPVGIRAEGGVKLGCSAEGGQSVLGLKLQKPTFRWQLCGPQMDRRCRVIRQGGRRGGMKSTATNSISFATPLDFTHTHSLTRVSLHPD